MPADDPRVGDKLWSEQRYLDGGQPNGVIIKVRKWEKEVIVQYSDGYVDSFDFFELEGNWYDTLGGIYKLNKT